MLRSLVALAIPLILLVSCTDDPEPILAPSTSPTPTTASSEPSPSPTESAEPESPEEFIKRWNELGTEMQNTGETDEFLALSAKSCQPCQDLAEVVSGYFGAGGYVETGGLTIKSIRALNPGETRAAEFIVAAESAPTEYKESSSGDVQTLPGGKAEFRFVLTQRQSEWLVTDYLQRAL